MNEPVACIRYAGNGTAGIQNETKPTGFFFQMPPKRTFAELTHEDAKQKLIRIMGTFDLATGHADTFDELLDSLEAELKDVLGYYREALRKAQEK